MSIQSILEDRFQTYTFSDKPVEEDKIQTLIDNLKLVPSKQNLYPYKIVLLDAQKEFKQWLVDNHTWCKHGKRLGEELPEQPEPKRLNNQYNAPLLFCYARKLNTTVNNRSLSDIEIGMSSMALVCSAEELGLNTAFGKCHNRDWLAEQIGLPEYVVEMVVGVGYAADTSQELAEAQWFWNDKELAWQETGDTNKIQLPEKDFTAFRIANIPAMDKTPWYRANRKPRKVSDLVVRISSDL